MRFKLPPLHPSQRTVADCAARYRALVTGRQWGKTRLGAWLAVREFVPQRSIGWWLAPTYQVSELGWRVVRRLVGGIERAMPGALDVRLADRAIFCATGGELWFKSADRPDNLRGATLDFLVMDEADYCDEYVWTDVLQPMLGLRRGRGLFISSPRLEGGWFHRFWQTGQPTTDDIASFQFPTWDSPYWDPKEVAQAQKVLPAITFRREYGAEFVSASGAIVKRDDIRIGVPPPSESPPAVTIGVDLAISQKEGADYTAMVAVSRDQAGTVYIRDVMRGRVGSSRVDLQACKLEYSIVSPK